MSGRPEDYYNPGEDAIERMLRRKDKSWVNYCLMAACLVLFLLTELTGDSEDALHMVRWGAAYTPLIREGETWRLFTCMFLHFGFQHLLNNLLLLFFLGDYVERALGKVRYLILYLGGGMAASLFSYWQDLRQGQDTVSAGASGAIFAVLGGLVALLLLNRGRLEDLTLPRVLLMAGLSLLVGFQSVGVDGFAHLGGFLAGVLLLLILKLPDLLSGRRG